MEQQRKCGFRKIGGLYLCGDALSFPAMPIPITPCSCCGHEIVFFRGFKWMDSKYLLKDLECPGYCVKITSNNGGCAIRYMKHKSHQSGLMWIGDTYYTPSEFVAEAKAQGISKRIAAIPKNFKIGETWVFFAHQKAVVKKEMKDRIYKEYGGLECVTADEITTENPGIFYAFKPSRIELIVTEDMQVLDWVTDYAEKGVTLVTVPDAGQHHPKTRQRTKRHQYLDSMGQESKIAYMIKDIDGALG